MNGIYLDYAATAPILPAARRAMENCPFGNPNSAHADGLAARAALEQARETIARNINCDPSEVYFTSGATEACAWALNILFRNELLFVGRSLEISPHEHSVVHDSARIIRAPDGVNDFAHIFANNETGEIYDVARLAQEARERNENALFFSDATAAVGHIHVDFAALDIDYMAFGSHKFGGAKGTGCLIARKNAPLFSLISGGGQERGKRGGTQSVELAVGMAAALQCCTETMQSEQKRLIRLRDNLILGLLDEGNGREARLNGAWTQGSCENRLPNNVNMAFPGVSGEALAMCLSEEGIYVSTGAACSSGKHKASRVLLASGVSEADALSSIRITMGRGTTAKDIDTTCRKIIKIVKMLKSRAGG